VKVSILEAVNEKRDYDSTNGVNLVNVRCQDLSLYESSSIRGTWLDLSLSSA
jgi:hypothetical protein